MKNKKILITGGAGYIGDCIIDYLINNNKYPASKIYAVDNLLYTDMYMRPDINFKKMDITSAGFYEFVKEEQFDVIIHLAAIVGQSACSVMSIESIKINEVVVHDLCKIIKSHLPKTRLIFSSTCSVYGNNNNYIDENSEVSPLGLYAASKVHSEEYVRSVKNHIIFRLPTLYGLSTAFGRFRTDLVANILTLRACEGQKLVVIGGDQWRPLMHVQDVGKIFAEAVGTSDTGTYILGGKNYKVIDIAKEIDALVGSSGGIEVVKANFNELRNYKVDPKKSFSAGSEMRHSLQDGVLQMEEYIKAGRIKNPWDMKFDNGRFIKHITKE